MATYTRKNKDTPDTLKHLTFHGMEPEDSGVSQVRAVCPFCGEHKFYWSKKIEKGDCKVCRKEWNVIQWVRTLWEESEGVASPAEYEELALNRGLTNPDTLVRWGVRKSKVSEEWLVPGFNFEHKLVQLYRYTMIDGKMRLLATPGLDHGMHTPVPEGKNTKGDRSYICEGPWDGMVWDEMLRGLRRTDDGRLVITSNVGMSLAADANVYAVPGANVWKANWNQLVGGTHVYLMFDSDHPNPQGSKAGYDGMRAAAGRIAWADDKPKEIWYLNWGEGGYDKDKPHGYDVKDAVSQAGERIRDRIQAFSDVYLKLTPIPDDWVPASKPRTDNKAVLPPLPCSNWKTLVNQWRKATRWPPSGEGLDHALAGMLAVCASTMAVGDQVWMKVIGPAAAGKTMLCDALGIAEQYVRKESVLRGFHSGHSGDGAGGKESFIQKLNRKTLVVKDGDTLMTQGNVDQILAEARDLYDRSTSATYRNGVSYAHDRLSITFIICGTAALKAMDKSELGERCLDLVVMDGIDREVEKDIQRRVSSRVFRNLGVSMDDEVSGSDDPEKMKAQQLTAGYVVWLRENAAMLLGKVGQGVSEETSGRIEDLATFVACCRSRPSARQKELAEREMASRLTSQLAKMAGCLAAVLNCETIDAQVMRRVERIALDTARGITFDLVRELGGRCRSGTEVSTLANYTHHKIPEVQTMMEFLRRIKVVEWFRKELTPGVKGKPSWRLSKWFKKLYDDVMKPMAQLKGDE